ncbi:MAG6410 family transglutaminase-related lipoprotein [Mycoplasma mycoides]|uniref:MAG6410 family transglutaminase-related lipoprotein n=1 Tax=Mycoplasma mycoides TaxID=2102 RepID=UPI002732B682|nr:transglutaminase domain-containing protein [Mycoplasma mycoides]MDP4040203.1 transglutaminase domain-containing protein [Mycoplasma mycoides]MDP4041070.1 transglutaminase domain-containing protein [Mycoplasma mycoides]MDP4041985.1 transglutaminase domain-containing protein [Mycoplasma mycoides]MDP4043831.1 transglutaminase domain-containing protein [Mycoplasma mycoides]MDP4044738.1 transglutaminase domain-containing protein [Mycoplasma mycoides]
MKRTKLISILTCLTALTSSIVVVSCSNDKTTTLHNKQINISKLDLNTNLYDIKDNTPKTIIKTFLDINNHKLSNLNQNQLEVKMINDSNAIINIKNSNQFIGNTNIKFEAKENKINPTVITNTINWTNLTPALININSLNLITNLTNLNNSNNITILDEFLKVNQTVLKDLTINNFEIIKKEDFTLIVKVKNSKKYFGTIELKFEIKEPKNKSDIIPGLLIKPIANKKPNIKPEVESTINITNPTSSTKPIIVDKKEESELISAFKLQPASSTKPQPRKKREVKEEQPVVKKGNEVVTKSIPLTPLKPAVTIVNPIVKEQETFENITISSSSDINDVNNTYIDRTLKAFNKIDLNENKAKEMMLNNYVAPNFYSHPRFELNKELIVLDKNINKKVELKLFDKDTQKEVDSSQVKWYQRTRYPEDKVFEANSNDTNTTFKLSSNGILEWKDTKGSDERSTDEKSARVWAIYKGYLYSAVVKVYSEYLSDVINNEELAKQAAKKLVDEQKWNELPPLQRLIKAYEWMTKEVKYDHDLTSGPMLKNQNAHSALVRKYTVCTGYAKGLKLILEELGIPCRFIEGSSDRESTISKHAWNLVQLDNEWYHVDATSDRTNTHTNFNFFLNTNDDFDKKDKFTKDFENQGKRWRNLKFKNFVSSEEDVLALIDNNWNIDKKQINTLSLVINNNNFKIATDAFNKRNLDVKNFRYGALYGPNKTVIYTFNQQSGDKLTEVKVNKVQQYNNKHAIKVELDQEVKDLKAGNFNIKNALIKDVKQEGNSYILTLDHFSSYNSIDIKLESIKKKDYKFNLNGNTSVNINVQRQEKPNAEILILDNDSIKITNNLNNLEYNFNNTSWKDVPTDFIIPSATIGNLYLRYKGSDDKLSSDSQKIDLIRSEIPTNNNIKSINKTLTGVNDKMQYRLKNNDNWTDITKNKVSGLDSGTYQIRIKPLKNALASEIIEVNIN